MSVSEVAQRLASKRIARPVQTEEGTLYIRGLNGRERAEYFGGINAEGADRLILDQRLVAKVLCNADGSPAFDNEADALEVVLQWDIDKFVKPAVTEILSASGLGVKSQEEAAKN